MPDQEPEPPIKKRKKRGRAVTKLSNRPVDPMMIPFSEAFRLLQHKPGYHSVASTRLRILVEKELPFERVGGRKEIWVHGPSVHEMIGTIKANDLTEDQKLIKHYAESPTNNYITALSAGLAATLTHAKLIFEDYRAGLNDPRIASAKAKEAHEKAAPEPQQPCKICSRSPKLAEEDHRRINLALTGDRTDLDITEERLLAEFQGLRCTGCWTWRAYAPIAIMLDRLQGNGGLQGERGVPERHGASAQNVAISPTAEPEASGRTSVGDSSAMLGADAQEAPLPADVETARFSSPK